MAEYKLSASLVGHEKDVRAVLFPNPKTLLSASRDGTVRSWQLLSDNPPIFDATLSTNAANWLNCIAYLPPSKQFSEGLIISGGKDTVIDVRQPAKNSEENADALLLGHQKDICALAVDPAGKYILSGSWDDTARIWPIGNWESSGVLQGHEGAVWAVLPYDSETIITACADSFIRIYTTNGRTGKLLKSIPGGTKKLPVRALCILKNHPSGADFASAGNDGVIRLWNISGEQVAELTFDDSFIYALASAPSGEIFAAGEDRILRVWKGSECVQTIVHPAVSVWSVAVCQETGDVVTGGSDSIVRVFTREPSRIADAEILQQFDASVEESKKPPPPPEGEGKTFKSGLPGPKWLGDNILKKDEGDIEMILEPKSNKPHRSITAYQWSSGEWVNRGEVDEIQTGIVDDLPKSKINHAGKEYDYLLDVPLTVEATKEQRQLKLAFNFTDNIPETAEKFLERNELGENGGRGDFKHDKEMVIQFMRNSVPAIERKQKRIDDEKKWIEEEYKRAGNPRDDHLPWGTGARHRPEDARSAALPPSSSQKSKVLPQKDYLSILNADVLKFKEQITKTNKSLVDNGKKDISLNSKEILVVFACCKEISLSKLSKNYKNTRDTLDICAKILTQWPYSDRGAALGLISLLARQAETGSYTRGEGQDIITILVNSCKESDPPKDSYLTWTIRAIVNLFASPTGISLAKSHFLKYQELITTSLNNGNQAASFLSAVVSLYINLGVAFHDAGAEGATPDSEVVYEVFTTLQKIITADPGVAEKGLVALGTFLDIGVGVKKLAGELKLQELVSEVTSKYSTESKIQLLGVELRSLFAIESEDTKMEG